MVQPDTLSMTSAKPPPAAPGLPVLGNALDMRIDPLRYFLKLYHTLGPVFRVNILGQAYTVMAGIEANRFLAREGENHLGSEFLFGGMAQQLGSDALLVALDGIPHRHQRKVQRRGYSRETILNRLPDIVEMTRSAVLTWQVGSSIPVFPTMQRIVTDHLGTLIGGRVVGEYFDDLWTLLNTNMNVHIMKTHPRLYLRNRRYQQARHRALGFAKAVLDWHRANPPTHREPDLIDDLLAAVDEHGKPYSDNMIVASIAGAYFAGMDTVASSLSFLLYAALKMPGVLERLQQEIDSVFDNGGLTPAALRNMPVLHNTAVEALRLFPVAPFTPRTVTAPFEFEGYTFTPGTQVFVANAVTHLLPEFYPNPDSFDIDRYDRPDQPKVPQAFAAFTLGAHTCLGAGMAEVQLMTVLATILRTVNVQLDPPDFDITIYANPIPNPGRKFAVKVISRR
jgi:cytochrome P450